MVARNIFFKEPSTNQAYFKDVQLVLKYSSTKYIPGGKRAR